MILTEKYEIFLKEMFFSDFENLYDSTGDRYEISFIFNAFHSKTLIILYLDHDMMVMFLV